MNFPLRIFDRNQGEKLHTKIDTRSEKLRDAAEAQVFSDVDSAYADVEQQHYFIASLQSRSILQQAVRGGGKRFCFPTSTRSVFARFHQRGE